MRRRKFISLLAGSAAAWPLFARAQRALPIVVFLDIRSGKDANPRDTMILRGLKEAGLTENRDFVFEYRGVSNAEDARAAADELVRRKVAAIFGPPSTIMLVKAATRTIPLVFATMGDPIAEGFVASLNRPGGNMTGVRMRAGDEPTKAFELLHELLPQAKVIGALIYPSQQAERDASKLEEAAKILGTRVVVVRAATEGEFAPAFAKLTSEGTRALFINDSRLFDLYRSALVTLAARHALGAASNNREFVVAGGLASYGASIDDSIRQAGVYLGRILRGENPGDLPVLQPTRFETVINMRTAKALGLTVPPALLARADEVIE